MSTLLKRSFVIIPVLAALGVVGFFVLSRRSPTYDFITVRKGTVVQEVNVTGTVQPIQALALAFEQAGRVSRVAVTVGSRISPGQVLVELDVRELAAELREAEANIAFEEAKLVELRRGARPEELALARTQLANAQALVAQGDRSLAEALVDAYTKADDAIRAKADTIFTDPRSSQPRLNFLLTDPRLTVAIEDGRFRIEAVLTAWGVAPAGATVVERNLSELRSFLEVVAAGANSLTPTTGLSQATIDTYQLDVSAARTNVNAAVTNVSAAEEKLTQARANVELAQQELRLKEAGATAEQLAAQSAQLSRAQARGDTIRARLVKYRLTSPIAGIVTKQDAEVGEIIAPQAPVVSVISSNRFEVEANVPEVDIVKLKLGQAARITLDAYGSDVLFGARVSKIDPGETVIDGVPTYRATFHFDEPDERIRSGMTANIDITTATREDVFVLPQRAIGTKDGKRVVRIPDGNVVRIVRVQTGLRGVDGNVEMLSGVREGDRVLIPQS